MTLTVLIAAWVAALPPPSSRAVDALFRLGMAGESILAGIGSVGGQTIWTNNSGQVWAVEIPSKGNAGRLYLEGAYIVSSTYVSASCLDWLQF
jgi:hypothetical protein